MHFGSVICFAIKKI